MNAVLPDVPSTLEILVSGHEALDAELLDENGPPRWIARLLKLSLIGLGAHGLAIGLAAEMLGFSNGYWLSNMPIIQVPIALVGGLTLALAVCLPTFWFYTQLAGVNASFAFVTAQALQIQARVGTLLLGLLPVYVAFILGHVLGLFRDPEFPIIIGFMVPFFVGLMAVVDLIHSMRRMAPKLSFSIPNRARFLSILVLAWGMLFTIVAPVAILWLGRVIDKMGG